MLNIDIDITDHLLIALRRSCIRHHDDIVDVLQFHTTGLYPMHDDSCNIAKSLRAHLGYFSDSTVDDMLDRLAELNDDDEEN